MEDRDVRRGSATGHAFTQLLPDTGPDAGRRDLVYGFHPKHELLFLTGGPGLVASEGEHGWTWKICQTVSQDRYDAARGQIEADIANPPRYVFLSFNCTDWAYKIARRADLDLPSASVLGGIFDPARLASKLRERYERGERTFGSGRIFPNRDKVLPRESLESKRAEPAGARPGSELEGTESLFEILDLAFGDHRAAAEALDLSASRERLPRVQLGQGDRLEVSLRRIDPDEALTQIRFGDGERETVGERFEHSYDRPGRYRVRGIAIAKATVHRFAFAVQVGRHGPGAALRVRVPAGDPEPDGRPRLEPPVDPAG